MIEVKQLTKSYRNVMAVDNVSFSLDANRIYGLLGRNGAGKTTIMNMLTGQWFPTHGDVKVFGQNPYENNDVLRQVSFIKESQKYPDAFTVRDVMAVCSTLFPNWNHDYASELIDDFQLPINRRVKKLSRGMLSSVGIVIGLASRAPITIFDEPYLGLDAVARSMFYDRLIEDYSKYPRTIILSTHLIDEVSRILEHLLVIDGGRLLLDADTDSVRGTAFTVVGPTSKVEKFISGKEIIRRESFGNQVSATVLASFDTRNRMEADELGLQTEPLTLQQLIIHLTNRQGSRKVADA